MTIFQFQDGESVPGQRQQMDVAKYLLDQAFPVEALETVEQYFETLYHLRGDSLDKKRIMEEFKNRQYNFAKTAKEFHLIEKEMKTLFIPRKQRRSNCCIRSRYRDIQNPECAGPVNIVFRYTRRIGSD